MSKICVFTSYICKFMLFHHVLHLSINIDDKTFGIGNCRRFSLGSNAIQFQRQAI